MVVVVEGELPDPVPPVVEDVVVDCWGTVVDGAVVLVELDVVVVDLDFVFPFAAVVVVVLRPEPWWLDPPPSPDAPAWTMPEFPVTR